MNRFFFLLETIVLTVSLLYSYVNAAPAISENICTILFTGPVSSSIIEIELMSGQAVHATQRRYMPQPHDIIKNDKEGQRLLVRRGKVVGFITGRNTKHLSTFGRVRRQKLPENFWDNPNNYLIRSPDDPFYREAHTPLKIYRKSVPFDAVVTRNGLDSAINHKIFLVLPSAMKRNCHYVVSVDKTAGLPSFELIYRPFALRSSVVHASQTGWRPDDNPKVAFVSEWMGAGGGLVFKRGMEFVVIDNRTGKQVLSGNASVVTPEYLSEDQSGKNFNSATVWKADFSHVTKEGDYRLCLYESGCSWPIHIRKNVWLDVHRKILRSFYHQRSGISIGPPWTSFRRPAAFVPGRDITVYQSVTPLMATSNGFLEGDDNFRALVYGATFKTVENAWGGYFDAGDWDRRIQHLRVARYLFDLYLQYPDFYKQIDNNIPESSNRLPDILDEALWGVDFFARLQTKDGGIRGGIESSGHPYYGETSWQESHKVYAYAPGTWSSYLYAATAARAALVLKQVESEKANYYRKSAIMAMKWADKEVQKSNGLVEPEVNDARNLAASELFRLTGDEQFNRIFLETTVFKRSGVPLRKYDRHDQAEGAWSYVNTPSKIADKTVQLHCRKAVLKAADVVLDAQKRSGFKWAKRPWVPAFGGAFTSPDVPEVVWAWWITGNRTYLSSLLLAMQFVLGANPLNTCYITGLGYKFPNNVMYPDARLTGQSPPEGLTVLGPLDFQYIGGVENQYYKIFALKSEPDPLLWPVMENFWDIFWFPMMCEFSIEKMSSNALITGVLAAR